MRNVSFRIAKYAFFAFAVFGLFDAQNATAEAPRCPRGPDVSGGMHGIASSKGIRSKEGEKVRKSAVKPLKSF
jgi:hypothetical protein